MMIETIAGLRRVPQLCETKGDTTLYFDESSEAQYTYDESWEMLMNWPR